MNNNEFYNYEDRAYIQPTLSSGEQEKFIDNFRDVQKQNNAQIAEQTYNLGTQVPSNLGGLGGGESYFTSRYQTPQVDEMVAGLKTAAKAKQLTDVMENYQSQLKNRYTQAQREYNKRQRDRQNAYYNSLLRNNSNGNGNDSDDDKDKLDITTNAPKNGNSKGNLLLDTLRDVVQKNNNKVNKNNGSRLKSNSDGTVTDTKTGLTLTSPAKSWQFWSSGGGTQLGIWPNGKPMTDGSTWKSGKDTFTVIVDSAGNRQVYGVK